MKNEGFIVMTIKTQFGLRIKELRIKAGLTQAKLAEMVSIDAKHQSCIENGKNFPSADLIEKYAKAFNIEPAELLIISHSKKRSELIKEMTDLLNNAKDSDLKLAYRLLMDILK